MEHSKFTSPSGSPPAKSFLVKKLLGVFVGAATGTLVGVVHGRGVKCPPWRAGSLFGREIDTEWAAFWALAGVLAGAAFAGRRVGLIGWSVITGMLVGLLAGAVVWNERNQGAIAGAAVGLLVGTALELSLRTRALQAARRRWPSVLLLVLVLGCVGLAVHLYREHRVAREVASFGGRVEWEFGCVRYISGLDDIDDAELCRLTDELETLASLKCLSISGSRVTDEGLACLERLPTLQWLYLGKTRVTDAGLPHLAKLGRLEYLDLSGTAVTDRGVGELRSDLPRLKQIRR